MDLFECPVCLVDMVARQPRFLSCYHTFCTKCLVPLIKNYRVTCPICRKVTEVKTGQVTELTVDFKLAQMKEMQTRANFSTTASKGLCQICVKQLATYKCKDCLELLCATCKINHGEIEEFKSHSVLGLCMEHQDAFTHMCTVCVQELYKKCMLLTHGGHKQYFVSFDKGMKTLQKQTKELGWNVDATFSQTRKMYDDAKSEHQFITQVWGDLREQNTYLLQMLKENEKLLKLTIRKEEEFINLETTYRNAEKDYKICTGALNSLLISKEGLYQNYKAVTAAAQHTLGNMQQIKLRYTALDFKPVKLNFSLANRREFSAPKVMYQEAYSPVKAGKATARNLKLSGKILDIGIKCYYDAAVIGNDVVMITRSKAEVLRLNKAGEIVKRYKPPNKGDIYGIDVHNNSLYMIQQRYITVLSDNQREIVYENPVKKKHIKILVTDNYNIYISDGKNPGCVFRYRFDGMHWTIKIVAYGLEKPRYMSVMHSKQGRMFVVTESGSHSVRIYNESWKELSRFGGFGDGDGQFHFPCAVAVTDSQTLLISDFNNNRVSHYTTQGTLLSHIVTVADGTWYPRGLVYRFPFLWVCGGYVKCYKLY